jgi:TonB-linked SusC/RagA family outer membrane protein
MKKNLLMSLLLMITLFQTVLAQTRAVSGRVTDQKNSEGLPGVTVLLKGTTTGVSTNADGAFTLNVPDTGGTLVFSSVNYSTQERPIGTESQFNVALIPDTKALSEIVVTGYGTQERRDVTGSVASVNGEAITNLASPSFAQQLAGRAAGVNVQTPSGLLGQQPRIQIRGTNSISSGTYPLVVVDGQPIFTGNNSTLGSGFTTNPLADINPNDIESYEILKDGSATAIYGSRAANGVILITTKRGRSGAPKVTYDTYLGVARTLKRYSVLGADDFITISNEKSAAVNGGRIAEAYTSADGSPVSTDWQNEIFRTGFQQNHVVSVSGGGDKVNYYFSGGYTNQNGVVKTNSLQRFSFRSNVDAQIQKWLKVGFNLGLTRSQYYGLNSSTNGLSGNVTNATALFPNVPVRNPDGTPYSNVAGALGQGNNAVPIDFSYPNIVFQLENNVFRSTNYRILGGTYLEVEPVANLRLRTQVSTDVLMTDDFQFLDPRFGDGRSANGVVYQNFSPTTRWNWVNTATYTNTFADVHKLNAVVGTEYQKTTFTGFGAQGTNISARDFGGSGIISGTLATPTINGDGSQQGLQSYFGRLNYAFKDRYLVTLTGRSDALSSLPEANRRGFFPGASVGWRISEEPFFKNSGVAKVWNELKIRGSYAQVGNTQLALDFLYASQYGPAKYGSQNGIGYGINGQFGNYDLKWERSKKTDVGIDFGFFNRRLTLSADYYRNNVDGAILAVRTPLSQGVPNNRYFANIGSLYNEGFEFSLNTRNIETENFTWTSTFNLSTNKNRITSLNNGEDILDTYNITRVGESVGALYGYDYRGVNPANGNPIYAKADGTLVQGNISTSSYVLYNPNNGADISTASTLAATDKRVLGQTNPKVFGGFSNDFTYKGFDLDVFLRYNLGNKIMNVTRQQLLRQDFVNNGSEILNRWQKPGDVTDVPRLQYGSSDFVNTNNAASTRFVESGSFLRLQNITLGYSIPQTVINRLHLTRVRVFAQVQNVATITSYKGVDPEVNTNFSGSGANTQVSNTQAGIDYSSNPQQRVFTGGLNVAF